MLERFHRGRIAYERAKGGGQEWFSVTVLKNGDRTMRCQTEMEDIGLLRDVTQTLDKDWRPVDSFVRISQNGEFTGSAWFRMDDTGIECEAFTRGDGRVSQRIETEGRVKILASHPVMADAWQCASFDHSRPEKRQIIKPWAHTSPRTDGSSGPLAGVSVKTMDYVGEERVTVPAGTFDTRKYHIHYSMEKTSGPMEVCVTGPDFILVHMTSPFGKYYLTEYTSG